MAKSLRALRRKGVLLGTVAIAMILSIGLAACGGDDADTDTAANGEETTTTASVESQTLRWSSFIPEATPLGQMYDWWMNEVTERTDGAVEFNKSWDGTLVGPEETLPALRDGRIQVGQVSPPYYPETLPLSSIPEVPFITDNQPAATLALTKLGQAEGPLVDEWHNAGVIPVAIPTTPPSVIGTNETIETVEDMQGLRVRVIGRQGDAVQAVGANPITLETAEVYESIQRGLTDAYMGMPFDFVTPLKLNEVADNVIDPGLGVFASNGAIAVGQDAWDELPEDVQQVMLEVGMELPDKALELFQAGEDAACEALETPPTYLSDAEVDKWREAIGDDALNDWKSDVNSAGADADAFYDEFQTALDEASEQYSDYESGAKRCAEQS